MKPLVRRQRADEDVAQAIAHYLGEAPNVALRFVDELERAYTHIQRYPATGSPRYAHELQLPGLRFWTLKRFPYMVFYMERTDIIDIWRVLHGHRDIPATLQIAE